MIATREQRRRRTPVAQTLDKRPDGAVDSSVLKEGEVSIWISEITRVWSRGTGNAMELARVIGAARQRLQRGQWTQVLKLLPFSKRKADMLATIGRRLAWLNEQTFAHFPSGWSILYQLAQLARAVFEKLLQQGLIHPKLTLQEAKELVARFNGRWRKRKAAAINLQRHLRQFREYIQRTQGQWTPAERKLAKHSLRRLLEEISASDGGRLGRLLDDGGPVVHRTSGFLAPYRAASIG